jgi:4-azaleucine resistance transporter AzlC
MLRASPIVLAYLPVGFALGVLSGQVGYNFLGTLASFVFVFSGSGQSISLQMLRTEQPLLAIWSTTIIINLRYALMTSVLAPEISSWRAGARYFFSWFITDETFALHSSQFKDRLPPVSFALAVNLTAWGAWILGGVLGFVAGAYVADVKPYGFDFAVSGMFIALVVMQVEDKKTLFLAITGALFGVGLTFTPVSGWSVILTGVVCATLGTIWELWEQESA